MLVSLIIIGCVVIAVGVIFLVKRGKGKSHPVVKVNGPPVKAMIDESTGVLEISEPVRPGSEIVVNYTYDPLGGRPQCIRNALPKEEKIDPLTKRLHEVLRNMKVR